jgi:hypothetical protein
MHVQIVSFRLIGIDEEGYLGAGSQLAPAIAEMPGLIAKLWLADPERNAYGGVYLWRDRAAMESYIGSALFESVTAFPHFAELVSRDFAVHEDLTRVTQPGLPVLAPA